MDTAKLTAAVETVECENGQKVLVKGLPQPYRSAPELLEALEWYRERAESLASDKAKNPDYAVAVVTELSLDAGIRARAAIAAATGEG